jgi:DNA repair protein RadA/Sms
MSEKGLQEVTNPSALFVSEHRKNVSGTAIFAGMEGSRPLLVEIQALVAPTFMASPRRAAVGWDTHRLAMLIAVLATRYGVSLVDKEVYLNVVGGLEIDEPAADLAVASALLSAASNFSIPEHTVIIGEVGLSGEVRMVGHMEARLKEAAKLGFTNAIIPYSSRKENSTLVEGIKLTYISHIKQLKDIYTSHS